MHRLIDTGPRHRFAQELSTLLRELTCHAGGYCTRTLLEEPSVGGELVAMQSGARLRPSLPLGGSLEVLTGLLVVHVGEHCGDEWDLLPYSLRNTEGAGSFYALDDHVIELPPGTLLALDPILPPDLEAIDDSVFLLDVGQL